MNFLDTIIGLIILLFSAILHEIAHGFVADKLGDPTARIHGRLTLDPRKHIDPIMSLIFPLILLLSGSPVIFGAAKPVPVDPFNLREGRKDVALVSLAGPLTNIVLAIFAAILIKVIIALQVPIPFAIFNILSMIVLYNVSLAIFNLLPIPPLDGSKIVALLLPERAAQSYLALGIFGMLFIFFLLIFFGSFLFNLNSFALKLLGL